MMKLKVVLMMVLLIVMVGCSATPDWVEQGSSALQPEWIEKGSDAFNTNKVEVALYGVGSVQGIHNESLAWEIAEGRARSSLARIFQSKSGYDLKEDVTIDFDRTKTNPIHQDMSRKVSSVTDVLLKGARVADRYKDSDTNIYYVLVKLPHKYITSEALVNGEAQPE